MDTEKWAPAPDLDLQANIAHALEKTKYTDADINWWVGMQSMRTPAVSSGQHIGLAHNACKYVSSELRVMFTWLLAAGARWTRTTTLDVR